MFPELESDSSRVFVLTILLITLSIKSFDSISTTCSVLLYSSSNSEEIASKKSCDVSEIFNKLFEIF